MLLKTGYREPISGALESCNGWEVYERCGDISALGNILLIHGGVVIRSVPMVQLGALAGLRRPFPLIELVPLPVFCDGISWGVMEAVDLDIVRLLSIFGYCHEELGHPIDELINLDVRLKFATVAVSLMKLHGYHIVCLATAWNTDKNVH